MNSPIRAFFRLDDTLATGAQPGPADFDWLQAQRFRAVLNVNTSTARNYLSDEQRLAEQQGLRYLHQPLDCAVLTPDKYEAFRDALRGLLGEGPVFVHCAGNVKVTGMMHLYRVLERREPLAQAAADLQRLPELEPKWYAFFEAMGVPTPRPGAPAVA